MLVIAGRGGGAFVCVSAKAALEPFAGHRRLHQRQGRGVGLGARARRPVPRRTPCGPTRSCPASSTPRRTVRPCPTRLSDWVAPDQIARVIRFLVCGKSFDVRRGRTRLRPHLNGPSGISCWDWPPSALVALLTGRDLLRQIQARLLICILDLVGVTCTRRPCRASWRPAAAPRWFPRRPPPDALARLRRRCRGVVRLNVGTLLSPKKTARSKNRNRMRSRRRRSLQPWLRRRAVGRPGAAAGALDHPSPSSFGWSGERTGGCAPCSLVASRPHLAAVVLHRTLAQVLCGAAVLDRADGSADQGGG